SRREDIGCCARTREGHGMRGERRGPGPADCITLMNRQGTGKEGVGHDSFGRDVTGNLNVPHVRGPNTRRRRGGDAREGEHGKTSEDLIATCHGYAPQSSRGRRTTSLRERSRCTTRGY